MHEVEATGRHDSDWLHVAGASACLPAERRTGAGVPIQPVPWRGAAGSGSAVLAIPCLDTTRVAKDLPELLLVLRPRTAPEGPRTCPPLFRPLDKASPPSILFLPQRMLQGACAEYLAFRKALVQLKPSSPAAPHCLGMLRWAVWLESLIARHRSGMEHAYGAKMRLSHAVLMYRLHQLLMAAKRRRRPRGRHLSTAPRAVHAERSTQPDLLQPSERTAPETLAISGDGSSIPIITACTSKPACLQSYCSGLTTDTAEEGLPCASSYAMKGQPLLHADLAIAPYKEAVGGLWREKWGWSRPIPRTTEARKRPTSAPAGWRLGSWRAAGTS